MKVGNKSLGMVMNTVFRGSSTSQIRNARVVTPDQDTSISDVFGKEFWVAEPANAVLLASPSLEGISI